MKKTILMVVALLCAFSCFSQVVDFEDLTLNPNSSWIGADGTGQFTSSYLTLYNDYDINYGSWQGFGYTNGTDTESEADTNLSSCVGHGAGNSEYYVTAYVGFDWMGDYSPIPVGMKINTEIAGNFAHRGAYFCMPVALKKYVDREYPSGHFYYKLKASAYANGTLVGEREIMMADFSGDNSYMMDDWTFVDLSWIENADSLNFIALSDDANAYGILTPAYFSMDDFGAQDPNYINYTDVVDFEEFDLEENTAWYSHEETGTFQSSYLTFYSHYDEDWGAPYWEGFAYTNGTSTETNDYNDLSAATGSGNDGSENYATCYIGFYNMTGIKIDTEHSVNFENRGAYFCLPAYVSSYIGDENGTFAENHYYYSVKITAYAAGEEVANREIVMADFREDENYKMDEWTFVDFSWIANADSLYFSALSNDANEYGLLVPSYFCMDDFGAEAPVEINYTEIVDFEEFDLEENSAWYSHEETGTFQSSYLTFYSHYDEDWGAPYWEGFAYTNGTSTETNDYNDLSAATGSGNDGSENYATCYIGFYNMTGIKIDTEHSVNFENRGAYFCLPAYVSSYIGDENGTFAENQYYYSVKITAYAAGEEVANREIVMADFRDDASYKMDDWTFVDLSWIENADSLYFSALSNDANEYGLLVPSYFCMDDFGAENPGSVYVNSNIAESLSIDAYFDAAGMLNLSCESRINDVYVYDMAGRLVMTVAVNDNNISMPFDVVNGMYIISARTEKGMATCKVINNR